MTNTETKNVNKTPAECCIYLEVYCDVKFQRKVANYCAYFHPRNVFYMFSWPISELLKVMLLILNIPRKLTVLQLKKGYERLISQQTLGTLNKRYPVT